MWWGGVGWGGDNVQVHVRTGVMLRSRTFIGTYIYDATLRTCYHTHMGWGGMDR